MYGLEEAMVEFDDYFEGIVSSSLVESGLELRRLKSEPAVFHDSKLDVTISKHVDDGLVVGPEENVKKVLKLLGHHLLLKIEPELEIGEETKYVGRIIRRKRRAATSVHWTRWSTP